MQTLNLTNLEKSNIKYTISHFPDGEVQISLEEPFNKDDIHVICRITSAEELFILMQVADILNRNVNYWDLAIYYLMGTDRVMSTNRPFTLNIIAKILDNLQAAHIWIFEPHSEVTLESFDFTSVSRVHPWKWGLEQKERIDECQLVLPDAGAAKRYFDNDVPNDVLIGKKVRDVNTGKIQSIRIENPEALDKNLPLLVLDDLCDGGGTFVGLAIAIKEINPDAVINIVVSHMVNPKGIENLSKNYNHVWFTNSYKTWEDLPDNVTQIKVI